MRDRTGGRIGGSAAGGRGPARARLIGLAVLLPWVALAGCIDLGPDPGEAHRLDPPEFIDVIVELRKAEREVSEADTAVDSLTAAFERRKAEIFESHGTSEEALRDFLRVHSGDFALMSEVWDSITQRLKYLPVDPDSAAAPAPIVPPVDTTGPLDSVPFR